MNGPRCSDTRQTLMGLNTGPGAPTWHRGSETTHLPRHNDSSDQGGSWGMRDSVISGRISWLIVKPDVPQSRSQKQTLRHDTATKIKPWDSRFTSPSSPLLASWWDYYWPIKDDVYIVSEFVVRIFLGQSGCINLVLGNTWTKWGDTVYAPLWCEWWLTVRINFSVKVST